jgi:hypothetical protein
MVPNKTAIFAVERKLNQTKNEHVSFKKLHKMIKVSTLNLICEIIFTKSLEFFFLIYETTQIAYIHFFSNCTFFLAKNLKSTHTKIMYYDISHKSHTLLLKMNIIRLFRIESLACIQVILITYFSIFPSLF